jgi:hypothetical protein
VSGGPASFWTDAIEGFVNHVTALLHGNGYRRCDVSIGDQTHAAAPLDV